MIKTTDIPNLLIKTARVVFGQSENFPDEWKEIYTRHTSDRAEENDIEMKFLGLAQEKEEGSAIASDTMGERLKHQYLHRTVGNSFSITEEALEDNQYKNQFPSQIVGLKDSLATTKEVVGANLLNNAFDPDYSFADGQPLCSPTRPIDEGTYANTFTDVQMDLSEAGLERAILLIGQMKWHNGFMARLLPKKLIIPPQLQFSTVRLLKSPYRVDSSLNDINTIHHENFIPEGYRVNHFLVSPSSWFILTNAENGMKYYKRRPVQYKSYVEENTGNVVFKATERYSFGCSNARSIFGSRGT
ncbi:hypothetical protein Cva_01626 [Caedimonas varicaedens]|uniref:Mu-like prophage major head subunit gpT n=1 Tax=Caedimonas varicaedens TaxID=1629334 RepID=A0A0K8MEM4_9PROT|nr:hypothetical protein Cva_01626 [Caedimonas varicaedens]